MHPEIAPLEPTIKRQIPQIQEVVLLHGAMLIAESLAGTNLSENQPRRMPIDAR